MSMQFLLRIRFYVKSSLVIEAQEFFISTILAALNFDLLSICDIFKFTQKSKVKPYKIVKMADFNFLKSTKIDFT